MRGMGPEDPIPRTVEWRDGAVRHDRPAGAAGELRFLDCRTVDEVCEAISTLAVRGAPALGAAGGYGVALACAARARLMPEATLLRAAAAGGRPADRHPPHGREPGLGGAPGPGGGRGGQRPGGAAGRCAGRPWTRRTTGGAGRRRQPGPGRARRRPRARGGPGAHPLQRRGAGLRRVRHGSRRDPGRRRGGEGPPGVGRRDPARPPGGPPHRLGARPAGHPRHPGRRRHGRVADGVRRRRPGGGRRRPGGGQRRRGQQDRDLRPGRAGRPPRRAVLRGRPDLDRRPRHHDRAPSIPVEERSPDEVTQHRPVPPRPGRDGRS